jgi:hypothetical protein
VSGLADLERTGGVDRHTVGHQRRSEHQVAVVPISLEGHADRAATDDDRCGPLAGLHERHAGLLGFREQVPNPPAPDRIEMDRLLVAVVVVRVSCGDRQLHDLGEQPAVPLRVPELS